MPFVDLHNEVLAEFERASTPTGVPVPPSKLVGVPMILRAFDFDRVRWRARYRARMMDPEFVASERIRAIRKYRSMMADPERKAAAAARRNARRRQEREKRRQERREYYARRKTDPVWIAKQRERDRLKKQRRAMRRAILKGRNPRGVCVGVQATERGGA